MKTYKTLLTALILMGATFFAWAEIEFSHGNATGKIVVDTNQCIMVTGWGCERADYPTLGGTYIDRTNQFFFDENFGKNPIVIAGPHTFSFGYRSFVVYNYLTNTNVETIVVHSGETNYVEVPAGKVMQFVTFASDTAYGPGASVFIRPLNNQSWYSWKPRKTSNASLDGPITVMIPTYPGHTRIFASYYFIDVPLPIESSVMNEPITDRSPRAVVEQQ